METVTRCIRCLLPFGLEIDADSVIEPVREGGAICTRCTCGHECDCDSVAAHEENEEESLRDFLRNPGPPPAHWDAETAERVTATVERARQS